MARSFDRIVSRPHTVEWAGFRSTTIALQQAGWQLSAEQDMYRSRCRLAMHHREARLYAITGYSDVDYYSQNAMWNKDAVVFHVQFVAPEISVLRMADNDISLFKPIDAKPQYETFTEHTIDYYNIFAAPLVRTEEIIVEPRDVMAMLEQIKKMQAPDQAAIRQREKRREDEAGPQQRFHAQILSFDRKAA